MVVRRVQCAEAEGSAERVAAGKRPLPGVEKVRYASATPLLRIRYASASGLMRCAESLAVSGAPLGRRTFRWRRRSFHYHRE